MKELERYGLSWTGPKDFIPKPMVDGYWTPWHIADERVNELRQRAEKAEALLSEINNLVAMRWSDGVPNNMEMLEMVQQLSKKNSGGAWLLRKQAEVVEGMANFHDEDCGYFPDVRAGDLESANGCVREMSTDDMREYAQRLRQQADELEKESD